MVLVDTNIFVIDRFFKRDERYTENKEFIEAFDCFEIVFPLFSLLELCGISSFNLSEEELAKWLSDFGDVYSLEVLDPAEMSGKNAFEWIELFVSEMGDNITKKMKFGDAVILREAQVYDVEAIVTWNKKDFAERTEIPIFTPEEFLEAKRSENNKEERNQC